MIERKETKEDRFVQLRKIANSQLATLDNKDFIKSLKKHSDKTYFDTLKNKYTSMLLSYIDV